MSCGWCLHNQIRMPRDGLWASSCRWPGCFLRTNCVSLTTSGAIGCAHGSPKPSLAAASSAAIFVGASMVVRSGSLNSRECSRSLWQMPHNCLPVFGVTVVLMPGSSPETVCAKMYQLHKMRGQSVQCPVYGRAEDAKDFPNLAKEISFGGCESFKSSTATRCDSTLDRRFTPAR